VGRPLFPGNAGEKNRAWREFRSYIRQARAYDDVAAATVGSSAALPLYYAILNLAKAELLTDTPGAIIGQPIAHGLRIQKTATDSISGDKVRTGPGVFPLLYQKRTGQPLAMNLDLPVRRLLGQIPEIGWEVNECHLADTQVGYVIHATVADQSHIWSVMGIRHVAPMLANRSSMRLFGVHYEAVDPPANWRELLGLTPRHMSGGFTLFQSRWQNLRVHPNTAQFHPTDLTNVNTELWNRVGSVLDATTNFSFDAFLCPSLYKSKPMVMAASLARYATVFYLSSLVRYFPTQLDPVLHADQAWLFDSMVHEVRTPLLINALNGIKRTTHLFYGRDALRL
jgi:hypothetical protein